MDWQLKNDTVFIDCGQHMDFESIQNQKEIFIKVLLENKPVILQANKITRIDTASLQLLLVFTREAAQKNIKLEWQEPSVTLIYVSNLIGLGALLALPGK